MTNEKDQPKQQPRELTAAERDALDKATSHDGPMTAAEMRLLSAKGSGQKS